MRKGSWLVAGALLLAGCGAGGGNGEATIATDSGEIKAVVEMDGDQVTSVSIDETSDGQSKKEMKEGYRLKDASGIGKEWYEQIAFLENYLKENGSDALTFDDQGRAQNAECSAVHDLDRAVCRSLRSGEGRRKSLVLPMRTQTVRIFYTPFGRGLKKTDSFV